MSEAPELVVGVGASTGGLEAFKELLSVLPADGAMTFLLVQHLDPDRRSMLQELLAPCMSLLVCEAEQGAQVEADCVYIIRPGTAMGVRRGRIELSEPILHRGLRLPVDHLFRSLAREYGSRAVGVILSGTGSDGSSGLRDIKAHGGLSIAQRPESSGQAGMPQSAINTGFVDLVLDIGEIPAALRRFATLPGRVRQESSGERSEDELDEGSELLDEDALGRLAAVLDADFDLRVYKAGTVQRRVLRRMVLSSLDDPETYFELLREDPAERQALIRDLLISVTDFFRDPEVFKGLREMVIEPLVAEVERGTVLRAWVPGCATGEEAYSIAMEFLEAIAGSGRDLSLQLFATDVDEDAVAVARAGVYPASIRERVSSSRLSAYFEVEEGRGYRVRGKLRDVISFAAHDLTKSPPFSRMHLVSCRNVLIYLRAEAQQRVLRVLHFALVPGGHLLLSTSESTGAQRELFATVSKPSRIYKKVGISRPIVMPRSRARHLAHRASEGDEDPGQPPAKDLARQAVLAARVAPTIVVAASGAIVFMHGELGPFLRFPEGEDPRFDIDAMIRAELATRTRGALYKARRSQETVSVRSSPEEGGDERRRVQITASPAQDLGDGAVNLSFEAVEAAGEASSGSEDPAEAGVVDELERELQATREDLRNTVEELETSTEELRASNEESMSVNEELQSANEELEATTEELRSLNEELTTVNTQLREKVEQLEQAHDDIDNFFASTKVATIFLDEGLCIKRFTPAAGRLLDIDDGDLGRRVTDFARELLQDGLAAEAQDILDDFGRRSRELETQDGRWITRELLPYRTEGRRVEGVVVTFRDITELKAANEGLRVVNRRLDLAWEVARGGIYEHAVPLGEDTYHSDHWARILGYRRDELPDHTTFLDWFFAQVHPDDRERLELAYEDFTSGRSEDYRVELRLRQRSGEWLWVRGESRALARDSDGKVTRVLGMMLDISEHKGLEGALRESEARFREMSDSLPLPVWVYDAEGRPEQVNQTFREFFGLDAEQVGGVGWEGLLARESAPAYVEEFQRALAERRSFHAEARVKRADGSWRQIESWGRPRWTEEREFRGLVGASVDITERRAAEQALGESHRHFRALADNISQLVWMCDAEGRTFWCNQRAVEFSGLGYEELQGYGWRLLLPPEQREELGAQIMADFRSERPWEFTGPLRRADGEYRGFLCRAVPIRDDEGGRLRWFCTSTDISERRKVEEQLRESDRQKDLFLAMLGHELRNPLAAIRSATELLVHVAGRDPAAVARIHATLERQSVHMAKLIDGLLDVSRIIRGKVEIDREPLDLVVVAREACEDFGTRREAEEVELKIRLPDEALWISGDRIRLAQIIDNLLSNAAKFTEAGGLVEFVLRREGEAAVMRVTDTGVGIDAELLARVFEVFRQGEQPLDRARGGLGLGLALVRSLVELHGGEAEARSEGAGEGAEFEVRLPLLADPPSSAERAELGPQGPIRRVLVIEDNVDGAEMFRLLLEHAGYEVELAHTGDEGLARAKATRPDLVLCDLGLPDGITGYEVAEGLRADPETQQLRIIAVSGYAETEVKRRCAAIGFDAHLTKPVELSQLERAIAEIAEQRRDGSTRGEGEG